MSNPIEIFRYLILETSFLASLCKRIQTRMRIFRSNKATPDFSLSASSNGISNLSSQIMIFQFSRPGLYKSIGHSAAIKRASAFSRRFQYHPVYRNWIPKKATSGVLDRLRPAKISNSLQEENGDCRRLWATHSVDTCAR
jgi:hypothetical protein